ncbi:MAG: hypothetical protein DRR00_28460 [Candidatus Parabeggiatoa sp. nov. 3]|nr:MAG: hypothetical protein DRR00_28460 [Gammaproteobacteria bacterium]RKZ56467.1 MAG: hypothetical protein DRQ99_28460 [Gammaproteobacteria bacterium]
MAKIELKSFNSNLGYSIMTFSYIECIFLAVIVLFIQRPLIQIIRENKVDIRYIIFLFLLIGGGYWYLYGFQENNPNFKRIYLLIYITIITIYSLINFRLLMAPVIIKPNNIKEWVITIMIFMSYMLIFILFDLSM